MDAHRKGQTVAHELETAVADSLTVLGQGRHMPAPGTKCANCDAELRGPYCHSCGQSGDNHKRSFFHLVWEAIADMFHLDGRLARTLPDLFLRPGRLANDFIEGRLARFLNPELTPPQRTVAGVEGWILGVV